MKVLIMCQEINTNGKADVDYTRCDRLCQKNKKKFQRYLLSTSNPPNRKMSDLNENPLTSPRPHAPKTTVHGEL